jgi:tripartite-type tricarboxylate transporter receptor subunit TctC
VTSAKRLPTLPDVPTLAEANVKDVDVSHWVGIFAPGGTPADVVAKLNKAVNDTLAQPDIRQRLVSQGADVRPMSIDQFSAFVKSETDKYAILIRQEMCSRLLYGGCVGFVLD